MLVGLRVRALRVAVDIEEALCYCVAPRTCCDLLLKRLALGPLEAREDHRLDKSMEG